MPPRQAYQEMIGTGNSTPIPAPLKGLNTRDGFTSLQPDEARDLQNWLPDTQACTVRPGYSNFCLTDASVTSVPTLATFRGASGQKLIAAGAGGIWDVTGVTSSNLVAASTYSNNRWITENFNGYLFGVNGVDTPWRFNGTNVVATGFTGATLADLQTISLVKGRLWCTVIGSADVYYAPLAGVTGALTLFALSQEAQGGNCVGIGSWSFDGGAGPNDATVFIMSTGECIIYSGDPSDTFSKIGSYMAPPPVDVNPWVKIGGELVIMTANGPIPISYIYRGVAFDLTELQAWGKIGPSWAADYKAAIGTPGWRAHYFNGIAYFNIPTGATSSKQYVLNTRLPAWTTYLNLPLASIADIGGTLYFGSLVDGNVNSHTTGADNGAQITTLARQAYSFPLGKNKNSLWTLMRPRITANGNVSIQAQVDVDFQDSDIDAPVISLITLSGGAQWGDPWGSAWGQPPATVEEFLGIDGYGCAVAPVISSYSTADSVLWYASDVVGIQGGIV